VNKYSYRVARILKLDIPQVAKLLDVGCGNGEFAVALKEAYQAREVYGIDIGEKAIVEARGRGIIMVNSDLDVGPLPFDDDTFGLVFAGEIMEHLQNPDNLLREIYRVLSPNGYCIITTPNIANWYDRWLLMFGLQPFSIPTHSEVHRGAGTLLGKRRDTIIRQPVHISTSGGCGLPHIQFFTKGAFQGLLEVYGFKVVKVYGNPADEFTFPLNRYLKRLIIWLDEINSRWVSKILFVASGMTFVAKVDKSD